MELETRRCRRVMDGESSMNESGQVQSPVDNQTYNLLQILTSKLEAVEAYDVYMEDFNDDAAQVVQRIADDDRKHINELIRVLGIKGQG
jgi:hypothetical protein